MEIKKKNQESAYPFVESNHRQYVYTNFQQFPDDEKQEIHRYQVHYHLQHRLLSNEIEF